MLLFFLCPDWLCACAGRKSLPASASRGPRTKTVRPVFCFAKRQAPLGNDASCALSDLACCTPIQAFTSRCVSWRGECLIFTTRASPVVRVRAAAVPRGKAKAWASERPQRWRDMRVPRPECWATCWSLLRSRTVIGGIVAVKKTAQRRRRPIMVRTSRWVGFDVWMWNSRMTQKTLAGKVGGVERGCRRHNRHSSSCPHSVGHTYRLLSESFRQAENEGEGGRAGGRAFNHPCFVCVRVACCACTSICAGFAPMLKPKTRLC